jgi:hypothetical protein
MQPRIFPLHDGVSFQLRTSFSRTLPLCDYCMLTPPCFPRPVLVPSQLLCSDGSRRTLQAPHLARTASLLDRLPWVARDDHVHGCRRKFLACWPSLYQTSGILGLTTLPHLTQTGQVLLRDAHLSHRPGCRSPVLPRGLLYVPCLLPVKRSSWPRLMPCLVVSSVPGGITTLRFGGQMALRGAGSVLPF